MSGRISEHSADSGKTWREITPCPRSVVAYYLMNREAYVVYDDSAGNLYRWRPADEVGS